MIPSWLTVSEEVAGALAGRRPVVALESTLIAHGLPWPTNLATARDAEAAVRSHGAVPATIAVWHGQPTAGLNDGQLEELAQFLYLETSFPHGCYLMTGTGVVPPDSFTLNSGDEVRITVDPIGTLSNIVA